MRDAGSGLPQEQGMRMLRFRERPRTDGVLLHASFTDPRLPHLEQHLAVKGRTMGLLECGYHFLILPEGKLIGMRPIDTIGAHCAGLNHTHIGVCLGGGAQEGIEGHVNNFTPAQGETLRGLMDYIWTGYPGIPLIGHSEARPGHVHQCPPMDMDEVREWVKL